MRVILDTNVLMSAVFFGGEPGKILNAWRAGEIVLVASAEIIEEYFATAEALSVRYESVPLGPILALVVKHAEIWQCPPLTEQVCTDAADDKFLACALISDTSLIVSGDKALRRVSGYHDVVVVSPRQFVDVYLSS